MRRIWILMCAVALCSCQASVEAPVIATLAPGSGYLGDEVAVAGAGFGETQGSGGVFFDSVAATEITSWSASEIVVRVPGGASSGPVTVDVNGVRSNEKHFVVESPLHVESIVPSSGRPGDSVCIAGTGFGAEAAESRVLFGVAVAQTYAFWSDDAIVVSVPADAGTADVVVEIGGLSSNAVPFTVLDVGADPFELVSVYPASGVAGTDVVLTGRGFGGVQGEGSVCFGSQEAEAYPLWSEAAIVATVPDRASSGEVTVCVQGVSTGSVTFSVTPRLDAVEPPDADYGDVVSVLGSGFGDEAGTVWIGQTPVTSFLAWTRQVVLFQLPGEASVGVQPVRVETPEQSTEALDLDVRWRSLSTVDGLPNNSVYGVSLDGGALWAATWGGGVCYSTDDGESWIVFNTGVGLPSNYTRSVGMKGTDIWIGTNSGVCKSTDGGISWTTYTTADGIGNDYILCLAVDPDSGTLWAGTNAGGLSMSPDDGSSWTTYTSSEGLAANVVNDLYIEADSTVWAATSGGISTSADGGTTWASFTTASGLSSNVCYGVWATGSTIWVATADRLNKSTNGGLSWQRYSTLDGLGSNATLAIRVAGDGVWVGTNGYGVSASRDGGLHWTTYHTGNGLYSNTVRALTVGAERILLGTSGGISVASP